MNLMLMRENYPVAIIPLEKRGLYIDALEKASVQHIGKDFLIFIIDCLNSTFELYFSIIKQK